MFRNYALELNGSLVGKIDKVAGGTASAEVVTTAGGPYGSSKKQLGNVTYSPIELTAGLGMGRVFYDWIKQSWRSEAPREDGAVVIFDEKNNELRRQEFTNALLTETAFPALDASAKDPASITLKFRPEQSRYKPGSSAPVKLGPYATAGAMRWVIGNFRITIGDLEKACAKVTRIDALRVKFGVVKESDSNSRGTQILPGGVEFSNLKITVPDTAATDLLGWFDDFVLKGNNSDRNEKDGLLEYLTPDGKKAYFTIKLTNLGIMKIETPPGKREVTAEMYCEQMELAYDPAVALG
jgi:phage tail-like protein